MADMRRILPFLLQRMNDVFEESDDEDEVVLFSFLENINRELYKRVCIKNYVEEVVENYRPSDFKSHFRLNRSTVEKVIELVGPLIDPSDLAPGRPSVCIKKQILAVLWLLGNQETFRSVADRFDLCRSGLFYIVKRVCKALCSVVHEVIYWPNPQEEARRFSEIAEFPGIVGAIDGCHIAINAPKEAPEKYFNRNKDYSLVLQAVATSDLCFSHVFCSYPGSVHDARVYRNSEVYLEMCGDLRYFPDHTHLVGDSAYPLGVNLLTPFKNNGFLGRRQVNYNKKLSKSRVVVERAFGQLKGRFRRLKFFDVKRVDYLPLYVLASCMLHNICIRDGDFADEHVDEEEEYEDEDEDDDDSNAAINKRDYITGILP